MVPSAPFRVQANTRKQITRAYALVCLLSLVVPAEPDSSKSSGIQVQPHPGPQMATKAQTYLRRAGAAALQWVCTLACLLSWTVGINLSKVPPFTPAQPLQSASCHDWKVAVLPICHLAWVLLLALSLPWHTAPVSYTQICSCIRNVEMHANLALASAGRALQTPQAGAPQGCIHCAIWSSPSGNCPWWMLQTHPVLMVHGFIAFAVLLHQLTLPIMALSISLLRLMWATLSLSFHYTVALNLKERAWLAVQSRVQPLQKLNWHQVLALPPIGQKRKRHLAADSLGRSRKRACTAHARSHMCPTSAPSHANFLRGVACFTPVFATSTSLVAPHTSCAARQDRYKPVDSPKPPAQLSRSASLPGHAVPQATGSWIPLVTVRSAISDDGTSPTYPTLDPVAPASEHASVPGTPTSTIGEACHDHILECDSEGDKPLTIVCMSEDILDSKPALATCCNTAKKTPPSQPRARSPSPQPSKQQHLRASKPRQLSQWRDVSREAQILQLIILMYCVEEAQLAVQQGTGIWEHVPADARPSLPLLPTTLPRSARAKAPSKVKKETKSAAQR